MAASLFVFGWLVACNQPPGNIGTAEVTIMATANGLPLAAAASILLDVVLVPHGVPFHPGTGVVGVAVAELKVYRGGDRLHFDTTGNIVESGGEPILLTSNSATLHLPHGTYDFQVGATDDSDNLLADGGQLDVVINSDLHLRIDLSSFIESASLLAPQVVVPNQVVDVILAVHPPGRPDLVVPTGDFHVVYTASTEIVASSNRGLRLGVECVPISIEAEVTDLRMPVTSVIEFISIPLAQGCDSHSGPIEVDLTPPSLEMNPLPDEVPVGQPFVIT
ncbi:MAG: hypothetical protein KF813_12125, partial [Trueperaceae bacterium]|nr:hypothetical protein [Trueperaceae bacterium]